MGHEDFLINHWVPSYCPFNLACYLLYHIKISRELLYSYFVSGPGLVLCFVCVRNCVLFLYVYSILLNISKFLLISAIGPVEHVLDLNSWPDQPCCWDLIFLLGPKVGTFFFARGVLPGRVLSSCATFVQPYTRTFFHPVSSPLVSVPAFFPFFCSSIAAAHCAGAL